MNNRDGVHAGVRDFFRRQRRECNRDAYPHGRRCDGFVRLCQQSCMPLDSFFLVTDQVITLNEPS
jgi:hypothetical protein